MPIKDPERRRAAQREANRRYREANPERHRADAKLYYARHRERLLVKDRERYRDPEIRAKRVARDASRWQVIKAARDLRPDPIEQLSEIDLAYIAGLVDGEGCITMTTNKLGCQLVILVAMTARPVLTWLAERWGTKVSEHRRTKKPSHHKDQFCVRLSGKRAASLCARLLPFLKVKHAQAELGIRFGATLGLCHSSRPEQSAAIRAERLAMKAELHVLNDDRHRRH